MLSKKFRLPLDKMRFQGKKINCRYCSIIYKPNNLSHGRAAFIISKKNISKAVLRNKYKRLLRHIIKPMLENGISNDYLVIAKSNIKNATHELLNHDICNTTMNNK